MGTEIIEKILREALEMEEKEHDFYLDAAHKALNDITRASLEFLAENEIYHVENIRNFHDALRTRGRVPFFNAGKERNERLRELNVFSKNIKDLGEKIDPESEDVKLCELAMEFENNAYAYYEKVLEKVKDDKLVPLLSFLLEEETAHYELMENLHLYLTDAHNWMLNEDDSFLSEE